MRAVVGFALGLLLVACGPVRERSQTATPMGAELIASVGDQVIRVERTEDMPNLVGRASIMGRQRPRGFVEVRYLGLNAFGNPRFWRRDMDVMSTQTTVSESGVSMGTRTIQRTGNVQTEVGAGVRPGPGIIIPMPPDTTEFSIDLREGNLLTVQGRVIEIISATASLLKYRVRDQHAWAEQRPTEQGANADDRALPQNEPRTWKGQEQVRPPP